MLLVFFLPCPVHTQSLKYARAVSLLRAPTSLFDIEQASRAVCGAYKAARSTIFGEDSSPASKVRQNFKAKRPFKTDLYNASGIYELRPKDEGYGGVHNSGKNASLKSSNPESLETVL